MFSFDAMGSVPELKLLIGLATVPFSAKKKTSRVVTVETIRRSIRSWDRSEILKAS